jgi:hypothetical protein
MQRQYDRISVMTSHLVNPAPKRARAASTVRLPERQMSTSRVPSLPLTRSVTRFTKSSVEASSGSSCGNSVHAICSLPLGWPTYVCWFEERVKHNGTKKRDPAHLQLLAHVHKDGLGILAEVLKRLGGLHVRQTARHNLWTRERRNTHPRRRWNSPVAAACCCRR